MFFEYAHAHFGNVQFCSNFVPILLQRMRSKQLSNFVSILFHIWEKIDCGRARKLPHDLLPHGGKRKEEGGKRGAHNHKSDLLIYR